MSCQQWRAVYHAVSIVNLGNCDARFSRNRVGGRALLLCVTVASIGRKALRPRPRHRAAPGYSFYFQSKPSTEENLLFDQHLEHLIKYHELFLLKYDGKIKIDEPQLESNIMEQTISFLEKVIYSYNEDHKQKIQLAVIGSSIYNYAFQMERLNRLVEQYIKKLK